MRGDGYIYLRNGTWWGCVWRDGKKIRESLHTADEDLAQTRLRNIRRARDQGSYLSPTERRVKVDELLDDYLVNLKMKGAASYASASSHAKAVREVLGHWRAASLDTATLERTQEEWLQAEVKPATVDRRLEALRRAFVLALKRTPPKVRAVPDVPMLRPKNARQGFLARADFEAIVKGLKADPDLQDFVRWAWATAMRLGEAKKLTWEMFDRETWTLRLHASVEKARKGRAIALVGDLRKIIERRLEARRLECPLIFHREGAPIVDFRKAWASAAEAAGLGGVLFHDLRRSAIRNMVRAGVDVTVAMKISGHRTRSTFDRYNIVAEDDIRDAIEKTEAYVGTLPRKRKVERIRR